VTKFESGKLDLEKISFNLKEVAKNCISMNRVNAEAKGLSFHSNIDDNIPDLLVGDPTRINQILGNIISNAIKFTNSGKICVSARLVSATLNSADLQFIIRDTGIGMSSNQLENLFKPFTQADTSFVRKYGGTGLGMAISKQLIELMGGIIEVDSVLNEGTIIIISLNLPFEKRKINSTYGSYQDKTNFNELSKLKGKRVLIAEDHKINQDILKRILSKYSFEIEVANNGTEAIKKAHEKDYDIIFMDIQMPIMDGLVATHEIRKSDKLSLKKIPIVAMTAHAMETDNEKSLYVGMNDHLIKPIDIDKLEETLIKYLTNGITPIENIGSGAKNDNSAIVRKT